MTFAKHALVLIALAATAAAQSAPVNPIEATRKRLNTAVAPGNAAAAAALNQATAAKPTAAVAQSKAAAGKPAPAAPAAARKAGGRRDPFISPIVRAGTSGAKAVACSGGPRCLLISETTVRGIVRSAGGMIALVENPARRAYFLREKDPVLNGFVLKITGDTVIFRENTMDNLGNPTTREVTKSVNPPQKG